MSNKIVLIGSIVTIFDFELEEKSTYKIVSKRTGEENEISCDSILGKSLLGKKKFQKVVVPAEQKYIVKILAVENAETEEDFREKLERKVGRKIVKYDTIPSTAWYLKHPFQGGSCIGK